MSGGTDGEPSLSVTLITYNEEERLARSLESVRWANEIVVVDSGSTDSTRQIAREYTDRVLIRDWPGYGRQKKRAVRAARGDWILSLDADEVVSAELARSIRRAVREPEGHVGFEMARETEFLGTWLGSRGWWRDWKLRLFRPDRGGFDEEPVHEGIGLDGAVGRLEGSLRHYAWRDVEHRLEKENRYSTLSAARDYRRGRRCGAIRPYVRAAGWFIKEYLFRCGILHGRAGLLHSGLMGAYAFHRAVKLHELTARRGARKRSSENDNSGR